MHKNIFIKILIFLSFLLPGISWASISNFTRSPSVATTSEVTLLTFDWDEDDTACLGTADEIRGSFYDVTANNNVNTYYFGNIPGLDSHTTQVHNAYSLSGDYYGTELVYGNQNRIRWNYLVANVTCLNQYSDTTFSDERMVFIQYPGISNYSQNLVGNLLTISFDLPSEDSEIVYDGYDRVRVTLYGGSELTPNESYIDPNVSTHIEYTYTLEPNTDYSLQDSMLQDYDNSEQYFPLTLSDFISVTYEPPPPPPEISYVDNPNANLFYGFIIFFISMLVPIYIFKKQK